MTRCGMRLSSEVRSIGGLRFDRGESCNLVVEPWNCQKGKKGKVDQRSSSNQPFTSCELRISVTAAGPRILELMESNS